MRLSEEPDIEDEDEDLFDDDEEEDEDGIFDDESDGVIVEDE